MATIKALAKALDVRVSDFLVVRNSSLVFHHAEFRKNCSLTKQSQDYIRESVEEYFNRFYEILEILSGEILVDPPLLHSIPLSGDPEKDGQALRSYLELPFSGPLGNLVEILENKGILVCLLPVDNDKFNGINGSINNRPYIAIQDAMTPERIRTTIAHELAHVAFSWPKEMGEKEMEKHATAVAGAFLLPKDDALRELGISRHYITTDWYMICKEYGIAMSLLVVRAYRCGIIHEFVYQDYFCHNGKMEESRIRKEIPALFEQLVYRAVNEKEISIQKGAELLRLPFDHVSVHCLSAVL